VPDHGSYETEEDARLTPAVRAIHEASRASRRRGVILGELNHRLLDEACSAAGVEVGAYQHRILLWLAEQEPQMCEAIADIIRRAAQPPEGTVTQWGVRPRDTVLQYPGEEMARKLLPQVRRAYCEPEAVVVSRQVTPWTEAPEPAEDEDEEHG
jgi:hypothetical protein